LLKNKKVIVFYIDENFIFSQSNIF